MKPESFTFSSADGVSIFVYHWLSTQPLKGIVQIAHGMAEHSRRYQELAERLIKEGFIVYVNDHRGHGQTAEKQENLGFFAEENGWELVVDDMHLLTTIIKENHPHLPIFLLGHSMGSFLARRYVQKFGEDISGLILSGTASDKGLLSWVGICLAILESKRKGKKTRSQFLHQLMFSRFNKRTPFDWLSRDQKEVNKYIEDPLCGNVSTIGFIIDLLTGLKQLDKQKKLNQVPKNLPIFLFSGDQDPVGDHGKGVRKVYYNYQKMGIKDVSMKLYPDGRHEMLNEQNKDEVYQDIIKWLKKRI